MRKVPTSSTRGAIELLLVLAVLASCATGSDPTVPLTTMAPGWESRFALDWGVTPDAGDTRKVDGYVHNNYGDRFRVRLLVQAFDASGGIVAQRVEQMFGSLGAFQSGYFVFNRLPIADSYAVAVYSFDPIQSDTFD